VLFVFVGVAVPRASRLIVLRFARMFAQLFLLEFVLPFVLPFAL
jgi:hypothetical protein